MLYDLDVVIDCWLCGRLRQTRTLSHIPTDEEIAIFNKKAEEDHQKLHELRKIESSFEKERKENGKEEE